MNGETTKDTGAQAYAQTGHTPGPWTILGENLDCEIEIVAGGNTVCIVLPDDGTMAAWADARLIAAAPEMAAEIARLREALWGAVEYATAICRSEGMKPGQQPTRLTCDLYSDDGLNIVKIAVFDVKAAIAALGGKP